MWWLQVWLLSLLSPILLDTSLIALGCGQACTPPLLLGRCCSIFTQEASGHSEVLASNSFWNFLPFLFYVLLHSPFILHFSVSPHSIYWGAAIETRCCVRFEKYKAAWESLDSGNVPSISVDWLPMLSLLNPLLCFWNSFRKEILL